MQHGSEDSTIPEPQDDSGNKGANCAHSKTVQHAYAADTRPPTSGFIGGASPTVAQNTLRTSQELLTFDVEKLCEWLTEQGAKDKTLEVVRKHQVSGEDLAYGIDASKRTAAAIMELDGELEIHDQPTLCVKIRKNVTEARVAAREETVKRAEEEKKRHAQRDLKASQERAMRIEARWAKARRRRAPPTLGGVHMVQEHDSNCTQAGPEWPTEENHDPAPSEERDMDHERHECRKRKPKQYPFEE